MPDCDAEDIAGDALIWVIENPRYQTPAGHHYGVKKAFKRFWRQTRPQYDGQHLTCKEIDEDFVLSSGTTEDSLLMLLDIVTGREIPVRQKIQGCPHRTRFTLYCQFCGEPFTATRQDAKFCPKSSGRWCRNRASPAYKRKRKNGAQLQLQLFE